MKKEFESLCYIANSPIPSRWANSIQVMKMCNAFAKRGLKVELVLPTFRTWERTQLEKVNDIWDFYGIEHNFRIKRFPHATVCFKLISHDFFAASYAKLKGFDLVYTRDRPLVVSWLQRFGIPTIYESHYLMFESPYFRNEKKHVLKKINKRNCIGLVVISQKAAGDYLDLGISENKILVVHDGVDLKILKSNLTKVDARKQLNLPLDKNIVCYSGHLYKGKGVEELLACARLLPDILFIFVGGWEQDISERKEEANKMGLKNAVFMGFVPNKDVPVYLFASDILAMPQRSKTEHLGWMSSLKLFEYMAASRPIIATDLPTIREVLKDNYNAILIKPDSAEELAAAIKRLLENTSLVEKITRQAYRDVQEYSWEKRVEKILEFANLICERKKCINHNQPQITTDNHRLYQR